MIYQVLAPLFGILGGLFLVFLVSLFLAPYKQRNEAQIKLPEKDKIIDDLNYERERGQSRKDWLKLSLDHQSVYYNWMSTNRKGVGIWKKPIPFSNSLCRVLVRNENKHHYMRNTRVSLSDISPMPDMIRGTLPQNIIPMKLGHLEQSSIDISSGGEHLFDVAQYVKSEIGFGEIVLRLVNYTFISTPLRVDKEYILTLVAESDHSRIEHGRFRLCVVDGKINLSKLSNSHTLVNPTQ